MKESYDGLTTEQAAELLRKFGPNSLEAKKINPFIYLARMFFAPVPLMLLIAAFLSLYAGNVTDFWIILFLFFSNFVISIWHEKKADKSINQLKKNFLIEVQVFRDGVWSFIDSTMLVVGDVVSLNVGMIVPADIAIIESKNLSINESVLTGESLPKEKKDGDTAYSGSYVTTGFTVGKVIATAGKTFFGKTIALIDMHPRKSALEKDILSVSKFISIVSVIVVVILTFILVTIKTKITEIITLDLSLLIAGIPVALPTVMSLIISIGVYDLSKKQVVVRRLASLEDLANVDLLLSDKTGTLTQNNIRVQKILPFNGFVENEVIAYALGAVRDTNDNVIDKAILEKAVTLNIKPFTQVDYIPGDSERKRSTGVIVVDEKKYAVTLGAPQTVKLLCNLNSDDEKRLEEIITDGAKNGYRSMLVAINKQGLEEKQMSIVGVVFLADTIHIDAKTTIDFMYQNGIGVKMITGDSVEISQRVAGELGIKGEIYKRDILDQDKNNLLQKFDTIGGIAEVLPKDKYDIVSLARTQHIVAMTGDGVNDLPAVKNADVGFAVSNAVDALKGGADIILLKNGISVIGEAIIEARKIFTRLYNYSLYRISESFRIIITIAVIGLLYKTYPLTPVQLIVLAFLNDVPIISLAFDRVKLTERPSHIDAKKRFALSTLFGLAGVANSLILLFIMINYMHLSWDVIQTVFFLKLTVSGHMLVYVAHTRELWFKYLPSKQVISAITITQLTATVFAYIGFLTTPISLPLIVFVWIWSLIWMQISELAKHQRYFHKD